MSRDATKHTSTTTQNRLTQNRFQDLSARPDTFKLAQDDTKEYNPDIQLDLHYWDHTIKAQERNRQMEFHQEELPSEGTSLQNWGSCPSDGGSQTTRCISEKHTTKWFGSEMDRSTQTCPKDWQRVPTYVQMLLVIIRELESRIIKKF